ncbi:MAG: protein phosphatase CheZ [Stagnimonas sp.]|nr:protein phosphatase CheZ [Stagnimonas sp.]
MDDVKPSVLKPEAEQAARAELLGRLKDMTLALEQGDDALFAERLQDLLRRREDGFFTRIAQLTQDLRAVFAAMEGDSRWNALASELPDAGARLDHVLRLTEQAAHRTLDLVDESQLHLVTLGSCGQTIASTRARLTMAAGASPALAQLAADLQGAEQALSHSHGQLRGKFSELAMAQEYQDLSGQLLKRVTNVIREVERELMKLLSQRSGTQERPPVADKGLEGPVVPGLEKAGAVSGQDDADALLAMFM